MPCRLTWCGRSQGSMSGRRLGRRRRSSVQRQLCQTVAAAAAAAAACYRSSCPRCLSHKTDPARGMVRRAARRAGQ